MADTEVIIDDLRAHADHVDEVADQLSTAADAAKQVTMPNDAYGVICQPFGMLLDPVEQHGVDTLDKAVESMKETAEKVRKAADTYKSTEDGNDELIRGIEI